MRLTQMFVLLLPILIGCGSVKVIFKTPVEDRCGSAGLKGCPELTEGVLLYVQGDEDQGKDKLVKGAAENTPGKVKKFAKQIKQLKKIPGAAAYTKKLVEIANILAASSKAKKASDGADGADGADGTPDPTDPDDDEFDAPPPPRRRGGVGPMDDATTR